jgi:hypothetical protein
MKRSNFAKSITIAAFVLALSAAASGQSKDKGCSNASLQGSFAYLGSGAIATPPALAGPFVEVGTQVFDGQGNTTATAMLSQNGNIVPITVTGTYSVNSDCTGTLTLQVSPFGITVHVYLVISDNWSQFQAIETDAGLVITRQGRKIYPGKNI